MKIKKLITFVATGALVVSCLAITGCGADDTNNQVKTLIAQEYGQVQSNAYTDAESMTITTCDSVKRSSSADVYDVTAVMENNICKVKLTATATKATKDGKASYTLDDVKKYVTEVKGANRVPDSFEQYAPDFDSQIVEQGDDEWETYLSFSNPPFGLSEVSIPLHFNSSTLVWQDSPGSGSYKLSDSFSGTYSVPDSDITITLAAGSNNTITATINNPSSKERVKNSSVSSGWASGTISAGTTTIANIEGEVMVGRASEEKYDDDYITLVISNVGSDSEATIESNSIAFSQANWSVTPKLSIHLHSNGTASISINEELYQSGYGDVSYYILKVEDVPYTEQ